MRGNAILLVAMASLAPAAAQAETILDHLPQTVPGYDARFGMPLLARAQSRLRDLGYRLGPLIVEPEAALGVGYDSAVLNTRNGRGDAFASSQASMLLRAEPGEAKIAGYAGVTDRRHFQATAQSRTDWSAAIGAGVPLGGGVLSLSAAHVAPHEERSDATSRPSDRPIGFRMDDLRAAYAYRFNRLTLSPNLAFTAYRFNNTTVFGVPTSQSFRNRDTFSGGLGARYDLGSDHAVLLALRAADTRYVHPQPGVPDRNSLGFTAMAGLGSDGQGVWRYSLLVGTETRRFVDPRLGTRTTPVADLQLLWLPSGMTSLSARLTRAIDESAWLSSTTTTATRLRLNVEHEYARDLILHGHAGVQVAEPSNGGRTRVSLNAGARVTWLVNRNVQLSLGYDLARWNEGVMEAAPHETQRMRNVALATIRVVP